MPQCPYCGIQVQPAWQYCPKCRYHLAAGAEGHKCPSCSAPVGPTDRFCPNCRFQLRTVAAQNTTTPTPVPGAPPAAGQGVQSGGLSIGEQALELTLARQQLNLEEREVDLDLREAKGYLQLYQEYKKGKQDLEIRAEEEKLRLEKERIDALSHASLDVLISISDEGQSKLLAEVAQVRELQGFSPQQLLAKGAADNPEFAEAYKELLMGLSANGDLEQYERLVTELKESARMSREDYQSNIQTMSEMFHKAVDSLRDAAVAFSGQPQAG